jgi:cytochrome P450
MKALEEPVSRLANDLIDGFIDDDEIDFAKQFSVPFPSRVFLAMFGLPPDELPTFLRMKDGVIRPDVVVGHEFGRPETDAYQRQTADSSTHTSPGFSMSARVDDATISSAASCTPRSTAIASPTRRSSTSASSS